jgi:ATP synthase subunit 6
MSVKILGFYLAFKRRLRHLVPQGTPPFLIPLMVIIETLRLFAQPIALGLRLAANLTAGHLLIFLLSTAIWLLRSSPSIAIVTLIIFFLLFLLEVGVACIQAYVFTALIHFYLSQNL